MAKIFQPLGPYTTPFESGLRLKNLTCLKIRVSSSEWVKGL